MILSLIAGLSIVAACCCIVYAVDAVAYTRTDNTYDHWNL